MPDSRHPDLSLFIDVLQTLERIEAPYMIIGAFAGTLYGVTRVTFDIDIVVGLEEKHIQALAETYPLPRYYADPEMMRNSTRMGIMFNIIDTDRGEKADLIPLTMNFEYTPAFHNRVRKTVDIPGKEAFEVWCARPEDVIIGKLMAWTEGRSRKHETDIYDMLVYHYLGLEADAQEAINETRINKRAKEMGAETILLWESITAAAREESQR